MIGNVIGVIYEGIFCFFKYGAWETHTVAVWGPFCIIYGVGAVLLYVCSVYLENKHIALRFSVYALSATFVEYISGALLRYGLNMRAWNYDGLFLNVKGIICLKMTLVWGLAGILFAHYCVPFFERLFEKMQGKVWRIICVCLSVFMTVNLSLTTVCIVRWSQRHKGAVSANRAEQFLDEKYNDDFMKNRFCEWQFLDEV